MLFNSLSFCVFFPVVTALYFALQHRYRWILLLVASAGFYMAFVPAYIAILAGTILVDYLAGLLIAGSEGRRRKAWLALSIVANVGVLAVFKYWAFVRGNVGSLAQLLGSPNPMPALDFVLPIGLSFHTFQAMSYTIEVYRGAQPPERHLGLYALYVMYYPQLVAGPIERPQNLLHQFRTPQVFNYDRVVSGLQMMALGMFKKVVLADRLAFYGNPIWEHPENHHGLEIVFAVMFFSLQIYLDFSAYSEIAIGASRVMGIQLMQNFDAPYLSRHIRHFWRRWHISLSTWFRDYVYVPLGGNREHGSRNILIVFGLSGLWHGANWTYLVWGLLHGCFLLVERRLQPRSTGDINVKGRNWRVLAETATTFALVSFAWIFFRAPSLGHAFTMLENLFGPSNGIGRFVPGILIVASYMLFEIFHSRRSVFDRLAALPLVSRHAAYAVLIYATLFLAVPVDVQFIYFQF